MNRTNLLKTLGPGILFASTAIGVSHLVQSTRAGADYGFSLIIFVLAANVFKYPFFEFSSRYANATGTSLIDGYNRIGRWALAIYVLITLSSMFFVTAAVGAVTAGFMDNLLGIPQLFEFEKTSLIVTFIVCITILLLGKYKVLDSLIKVIATVLLISTLFAFLLTIFHGQAPKVKGFAAPNIFSNASIGFIVALMGWMPTALDLSSWNSLWTVARIKQTGYKPKLKETILDFNLGYITTAILSICFLTLGAYLMFGTGETFPESSALFANKVVELYTKSIGEWSYFIIAVAAFSIMFGTALAVFDGYARTLERSTKLLFFENKPFNTKKLYSIALLVTGLGSFLIVIFFSKSLTDLIDFASAISFLIAPLIAIANYKLVQKKYVGHEAAPPKWLRVLGICGIIFLIAFSIFFIVIKLN